MLHQLGRMLQVSDSSDTGGKIMAFYRLYELPVTMVLDPVTGAKMRDWTGFVEPDRWVLAAHLHFSSIDSTGFLPGEDATAT